MTVQIKRLKVNDTLILQIKERTLETTITEITDTHVIVVSTCKERLQHRIPRWRLETDTPLLTVKKKTKKSKETKE